MCCVEEVQLGVDAEEPPGIESRRAPKAAAAVAPRLAAPAPGQAEGLGLLHKEPGDMQKEPLACRQAAAGVANKQAEYLRPATELELDVATGLPTSAAAAVAVPLPPPTPLPPPPEEEAEAPPPKPKKGGGAETMNAGGDEPQ